MPSFSQFQTSETFSAPTSLQPQWSQRSQGVKEEWAKDVEMNLTTDPLYPGPQKGELEWEMQLGVWTTVL